MSFTGGALKLKGGQPLQGGVKKKKKKNTELASPDQPDDERAERVKILEGYSLEGQQSEDRRTAAEKKHEERLRKLEAERLKMLATKSHKEKIKELNEKLANLSEHHDIPKVGPG